MAPPPSNPNASSASDEVLQAPTTPIETRHLLYRLMVSQLFYDGYAQAAVQLTNLLQLEPACPPSEKLLNVVAAGLERLEATSTEHTRPIGLDLEVETEPTKTSPEPALYETVYVTSHKGPCRAGAFSHDGKLCATGSVDASIKILDVGRMLAKSYHEHTTKNAEPGGHPVIRTLYDHIDEVTCLQFHPKMPILASGSRDCTIKLFDFSKASAKKAFRTLSDSDQIATLSYHPTGDFLMAGCENQPVIRMYDTATSQCFVCSNAKHRHGAGVVSTSWAPNGKLYCSGSLDGSIKVWDGVSSQCVATFPNAHDGAELCSVAFTKNGKYVLSSGKDSLIKLWELSTTRCLIAYTGAGATGKQEHRAQAVLNHSEDYVMFPDEATTSLCCWDSRNASRKKLLALGHNGAVRHIVHSPTAAAFLTCSDDFRARFWNNRA